MCGNWDIPGLCLSYSSLISYARAIYNRRNLVSLQHNDPVSIVSRLNFVPILTITVNLLTSCIGKGLHLEKTQNIHTKIDRYSPTRFMILRLTAVICWYYLKWCFRFINDSEVVFIEHIWYRWEEVIWNQNNRERSSYPRSKRRFPRVILNQSHIISVIVVNNRI